MAFIVTYWHCFENRNWNSVPFAERLSEFQSALFTAHVETKMRNLGKGLFVASEYALAAPTPTNNPHGKPAEHITLGEEQQVITAMQRGSGSYELIVCAGSLPVRGAGVGNNTAPARNTCYGYVDSQQLWRVDKHHGVGEIGSDNTLHFVPGTGYAIANTGGNSYGVEICRDAHVGMLPQRVDHHIVVSASISYGHINAKAIQILIVAEQGKHGVYDFRHSQSGDEIAPYKVESSLTTKLKYYRVP